jgi:outer membrane usher protein
MVFPVLLSSFSVSVFAGNDFEEAFLRRDKNGVSQDVFMYQDPVMPGRRLTDIVINDRLRGRPKLTSSVMAITRLSPVFHTAS